MSGAPDLGSVRPRKQTAGRARATGAKAKAGIVRRSFLRFRARAMTGAATACFAAIMCGIVLNATVLQTGHHPAPLFGTAMPAAKAPVQPARVQAAPAPAPMQTQAQAPDVDTDPTATVDPAPAVHPTRGPSTSHAVISHAATSHPALHASVKPKDGIAQLLQSGGDAASHPHAATAHHAVKVRPGQHPVVKAEAARPAPQKTAKAKTASVVN